MSQSHKADARETDVTAAVLRARDDRAGENGTAAWELVETGRYMPRRIRGSFPGRELG